MPRFRLFRRKPTADRPAVVAFDRSALLRELEVSVPAPERIVRWDTATPGSRDARLPVPTDQRLTST